MKKIFYTIALVLALFVFVGCNKADENIIILYENDVHCQIEGYTKLAALKNDLKTEDNYVGVVSIGDYIQGGSIGAISQGEYIVNLMNKVGYDALTLGNHEFDYKLDRLNELVGMMNTKPICCNFNKIGEDSYFDSYSIVSYGDTDIAYIGVTTPSTITSSSPTQFQDENNEFIYTFNPNTLYDIIQENIDEVKDKGADYVIALTHFGYDEFETYNDDDITDLIKNVSGLDVVLDGHSHSVIEQLTVKDEKGNDVLVSSTGTKFANIGKLTIKSGAIKTELIKTETVEKTDPVVDAYIAQINEEYKEIGNRKIGETLYDLVINDEEGNRLVRTEETNLGDLCADAYYTVTGADISFVNGGGVRATIKKGDITFNDILSVHPYNNQVVVCKMTGQQIKDMLETSMLSYPNEDGSFPHMAGITFSVDTTIPTSVKLDENGSFISVDGEYRVRDIKVYNKNTKQYEDIDLEKEYTFASSNYFILDLGSGMTMFKDVEIVQNNGVLDVEVLEQYITEYLDGIVGDKYKEVTPNITFITEK